MKHLHNAEKLKAMQCGLINLQNLVQRNQQTLFVAMTIPDKATAYADHIDFQEFKNLNLITYLAEIPGVQMPRLDLAIKDSIRQGTKDVY